MSVGLGLRDVDTLALSPDFPQVGAAGPAGEVFDRSSGSGSGVESPYSDREYIGVKVTHFEAGGCELLVRKRTIFGLHLDGADADGRLKVARWRSRQRKAFEDRTDTDRARAAMRAKSECRKSVRQIGATHLLTFTTREEKNTREDLFKKLENFSRRYQRAVGKVFDYVVVPERHPSNPDHWHLHLAIRGWHHVNIVRAIWWSVCGGRGQGNVHINDGGRRIRALPVEQRSMKIASYLSKYMMKAFDDLGLADKKRWCHSKFAPALVSRFALRAVPEGSNWDGIADEILSRLGIDMREELWRLARQDRSSNFFLFADDGGFWMQLPSGWSQPPPPF